MADCLRCFYCKLQVGGYVDGLRRHLKFHADNKDFDKTLVHYTCMQGGCRMSYRTFKNLKTHVLAKHPLPGHQAAVTAMIEAQHCQTDASDENFDELPDENLPEETEHCSAQSIREFAAISLCRLKADVSFTDKKVQEVITFGESIIGQINSFVRHTVSTFLDQYASHTPAERIVELQNNLSLEDVFKEVKTPAKQQQFLSKLVGLTPQTRTIMLREKESSRFIQGKTASTKVIFPENLMNGSTAGTNMF